MSSGFTFSNDLANYNMELDGGNYLITNTSTGIFGFFSGRIIHPYDDSKKAFRF